MLNDPKIDSNATDKVGKNALRIALQFHPRDKELLLNLVKKELIRLLQIIMALLHIL